MRVSSALENGSLEIRVSDQGPGIPDYAHERVFKRFYSLARPDTGLRPNTAGKAKTPAPLPEATTCDAHSAGRARTSSSASRVNAAIALR